MSALSFLVAVALQSAPPGGTAWVLDLRNPQTGKSFSCAAAFADREAEIEVTRWIMGVWSGLNMAKLKTVGFSTDFDGVMGEVKVECAKAPSKTLMAGVLSAYRRLEADGR